MNGKNMHAEKYLHSVCVKSAVFLTALSAAAAWLIHGARGTVTLTAVASDMSCSAFLLAVLSACLAVFGAKSGAQKGVLSAPQAGAKSGSYFSGRPFALALVLGAAVGVAFFPVFTLLFRLFGLEGMTFAQFMGLKIVVASSLAYLMTSLELQSVLRRW